MQLLIMEAGYIIELQFENELVTAAEVVMIDFLPFALQMLQW
jgi:hypothetical protein